jgi:hypothetical protein
MRTRLQTAMTNVKEYKNVEADTLTNSLVVYILVNTKEPV